MPSAPTTDHPLQASLYELGFQSNDPESLEEFYAAALGYRFVDCEASRLGTARDRRLTIRSGPPGKLAYAAYAVPGDDYLAALETRLREASVDFDRIDMAGFQAGALAFSDPDGNAFRFGIPSATSSSSAEPTSHREARIQHVVFASTDVERMLAFFTRVVGFRLSDRVEDGEGGLRTFFVRCSHEHHSLAVFGAKENRLDHHCYETGDWNLIRDWADHFGKLRIPLQWGPGRHGPGNNLFIFVHDPDNNWLEISTELEHVTEDRPVGTWPHEEYTLNSWGTGKLRS